MCPQDGWALEVSLPLGLPFFLPTLDSAALGVKPVPDAPDNHHAFLVLHYRGQTVKGAED